MNDGEGPQRAENKEIAQETLHAHLHRGVVGGGKPEDPISRRAFVKYGWGKGKTRRPQTRITEGGGKPKDPDNRVRNQPYNHIVTNIISGNP